MLLKARYHTYMITILWVGLLSLSACSGGGSTAVIPTPTVINTAPAATTPTNNAANATPVTPTNTFPMVATPSLATQRINFFRQLVGVPPLTEDAALNLAAKNHANYLTTNINTPAVNGQLIHAEVASLPFFTGVGPLDRYVQVRGSPFYNAYVAETISSYLDQTLAINQLINSVYHQLPLLHEHTTHLGVAPVGPIAAAANATPVEGNVIDIVQPATLPAAPLRVYPAAGQTGLPIDFYGEIPDPMSGSVVVGQVTGSVMSMYAPKHLLVVASETFTEVATNIILTVETLTSVTDPNGLLKSETVFFIPHQILKSATQYQMSVQYSLDGGATLNKTWRFTTI